MISQRILNMFKSKDDDKEGIKNYITIITDMSNNENETCEQESVIITTKEFYIPESFLTNLESIHKTAERKLEIISSIDVDEDQNYYGKLTGFITASEEYENDSENNEIASHEISIIKTVLASEINIDFDNSYEEQPYIAITIDKQYEDLYRSYSTEFIKDSNDKYIGVNIFFNGLKGRQNYPEIGIMILGDPITDYYEEDNEKTVVKFICKEIIINDKGEEEKIFVEGANITFVEQEETIKSNWCGEVNKALIKTEDGKKYHLSIEKEGYIIKVLIYDTETKEYEIILERKASCNLTLSSEQTQALPGEEITFTGQLSIEGENSILLYDKNILLESVTTDENGNFSYSTSDLEEKTHKIYAVFEETEEYGKATSDILSIVVQKAKPTITLSADPTNINIGQTTTITGEIDDIEEDIEIKLYKGKELIDTITSENKTFSYIVPDDLDYGTYKYHAEFIGTNIYKKSTSNILQIIIEKITPIITFTATSREISLEDSVSLNITLNNISEEKEVQIYEDNFLLDTISITESITYNLTPNRTGKHYYIIVVTENSIYKRTN